MKLFDKKYPKIKKDIYTAYTKEGKEEFEKYLKQHKIKFNTVKIPYLGYKIKFEYKKYR